jgi:4-hydroxythreonine-4-phosphate dehydrogenase
MPTLKSNNKLIGITIGDPCGIGPEIVAKALQSPQINGAQLAVIADEQVMRRFSLKLPRGSRFIDVGNKFSRDCVLGKVSKASGQCALSYLNEAVRLIKRKEIAALVTAPVHKEAIALTKKSFHGHTEFLAQAFQRKHVDMMFVCDQLKTVIATRHLPISQVSKNLTKKSIVQTIELTHQSLKNYFRIANPRIVVCGLNPHAGEGGTIGGEEISVIIPAILQARKKGIHASGPFSADTLFYPEHLKGFDAVIAMYHDQGLIPMKAMYFKKLVNLTIGLPFVRTSPAHGTALDIAGKNKADPSSMIEAIKFVIKVSS